MRIFALIILAAALVGCGTLQTRTGTSIVKVLPHFLDAFGNHSDGPTLLHRDVYQDKLRKNPDLAHAVRYDVNWSGAGGITLILELRSADIRQFVERTEIKKIDKNHDGKLSDKDEPNEEELKSIHEKYRKEIKTFFRGLPADGHLDLGTMTLVVVKNPESHWVTILIDHEIYEIFGQPESWRVALWRGEEPDPVAEQKSFLW